MTPYFLTSPGRFHPPAPPAFGSAAFLTDLAEVSSISVTRTPAQVVTAVFWNLPAGTISALGYWDVLATQYIGEHNLDERAAAHVFALTNAATLDAVIGCWEAKFSYFYYSSVAGEPCDHAADRPAESPVVSVGTLVRIGSGGRRVVGFLSEHAATSCSTRRGRAVTYPGRIHYRFDITAGQTLGRSVGAWARAYDQQKGLLSAIK